MKLILVRHGETEENKAGVIQGHTPGKLTQEGKEQARLLSQHLRKENIDVILCSDLDRAKDTAAELMRGRDIPIICSPLLRERSLGIYEGRPKEDIFKAEDASGDWLSFHPQGGETFEELRKRAAMFLEQAMRDYEGKTVLVVSHGGFLRMTLGIITGKGMNESLEIPQENTCYNVAEHDGKWRVRLMNCTAHLPRTSTSP